MALLAGWLTRTCQKNDAVTRLLLLPPLLASTACSRTVANTSLTGAGSVLGRGTRPLRVTRVTSCGTVLAVASGMSLAKGMGSARPSSTSSEDDADLNMCEEDSTSCEPARVNPAI